MKREKGASLLSVLLLIGGGLVGIYLIKGLLIILILPFLGAYLLNPFVNIMERKGLSRSVGTLTLFLTFTVIITIAVIVLAKPAVNQVNELKANADVYEAKINGWVAQVEAKIGFELSSKKKGADDEPAGSAFEQWVEKVKGVLPGVFFGVMGTVVSLLTIVPLITFMLLRDGREIRRGIISLVPNRHFERTLILQYEISQQIGKYLRGELTRSLIVGTMITVGLWIVDGPYPILMGLFAAATNVIPFVGPYVGAAPAVLIALFTSPADGNLLVEVGPVALVYVVSQTLDMMLINPLVLGKSVSLHPLIIILSLMVGVEFLGILGMVLAVPVSSIIKVILVQLYHSQRKVA